MSPHVVHEIHVIIHWFSSNYRPKYIKSCTESLKKRLYYMKIINIMQFKVQYTVQLITSDEFTG